MRSAHELTIAIAFRLLGELDGYADDMRELVEVWPEGELHDRIESQLNAMRLEAISLPQLAGSWVDLMISHGELLRRMLETRCTDPAIWDELERHTGLVLALQGKCLQIATGTAPAA